MVLGTKVYIRMEPDVEEGVFYLLLQFVGSKRVTILKGSDDRNHVKLTPISTRQQLNTGRRYVV